MTIYKKTLILSEKKSEALALLRLLGKDQKRKGFHFETNFNNQDIIVSYSEGHLYSLKEPEDYDKRFAKWNLEDLPLLVPEVSSKSFKEIDNEYKLKIINELKQLVKTVDCVVIATDKDDQGQFIGNLILAKLGYRGVIKRWLPNVLTEEYVQNQFKNISTLPDNSIYNSVSNAEMIRSICDGYIGFNLTRLYTILSRQYDRSSKSRAVIGRTQTTVLGILARRNIERTNFKATKSFKLRITVNKENKVALFESDEVFEDAATAKKVLEGLSSKPVIKNVVVKDKYLAPPPPLKLASLQEYLGENYGYGIEDSKQAAEKNYEEGYTSYARTEDTKIPYTVYLEAREILKDSFQDFNINSEDIDFGKPSRFIQKPTEEIPIHTAITPTKKQWDLDKSGIRWEAYKATVLHFFYQFMKDKKTVLTNLTAEIDGYKFSCKGSVLIASGWSTYGRNKSEETEVPTFKVNEILEKYQIVPRAITKKKPKLYKEHELSGLLDRVDELLTDDYIENRTYFVDSEKKGIGSSATRSDSINNTIKHGLVGKKTELSHTYLDVTASGLAFFNALSENITRPNMFSRWEMYFHNVSKGKLRPKETLAKITDEIIEIIEVTKKNPTEEFKYQKPRTEYSGFACFNCGTDLMTIYKFEKKSWNCPTCNNYYSNYNEEPLEYIVGHLSECDKENCTGKMITVSGKSKKTQKYWKALKCNKQCGNIQWK